MRAWKRRLINIFRSILITLEKMLALNNLRLNWGDRVPLKIATYRGFGTAKKIFLQGRVLQDRFIISTEQDSLWKNFKNNLKRFLSREVPDAQLTAQLQSQQYQLTTDQEGYFDLQTKLPQALHLTKQQWYPIQLHLTQTPHQPVVDLKASAEVLIPENAAFGIISDIDDTILETRVTSLLKLRMLYLTFMKNAFHRHAFQAVGAFYTALQKGVESAHHNPIFYVSNSPWNLYDLLDEFLRLNYLPKGPILLRDFGMPAEKMPASYQGHKKESIKKIITTYPDIPFLLIGDSGERDTDIYLSVAAEFPNRISAIYIRDVKSPRRARRISKIIQNIADIEVHLIKDYIEAARHATEMGFMNKKQFDSLRKKPKEPLK